MRPSTAIVTLLLLLFCTSAFSTKMYKWRDDWGNVHYSHFKPEYFDYQEVNAPATTPATPADASPLPADQSWSTSREKPGKKQPKENADIHAANCNNARANLKQLLENPRIRVKNADGSSAMMGEDQRQAKIKESRKQIEYFCN